MEMEPNTELQPGDVLRAGRYEIKELLREAADKNVYLAEDGALACPVAVDVFANNNSIMPNGLTVSAWEARVLGQLGDHPNIAKAHDYWEDGKTAVMVTRYLSGGSLADLIVRSRESGVGLPAERIMQLSSEIARGLEHIHGRGILYRDLQPRNCLLDEWGVVHLVDFDTAVSLAEDDASDLSQRPVIVYTAPEITDGGNVDERADLYSLGATMYDMAAGHPPFAGSREEILAARRVNPPPPIERDDLPEALRELILSLLARDPEQRPVSAAEVVVRLELLRAAHTALDVTPPRPDSSSLPGPDLAEVRASVRAKAAEYAVGDVIDGRFEVKGLLGDGGFSKVYHIRDELEGEERALKLFDNAAGYNAVRREIAALRKIHHPNVVEVFWAGKTNVGDWYLITEFIEGEPLNMFITGEKGLRDREAVDVVLDVLDALVAFHPDSERLNELDAKRREGDLSEAEYREYRELNDKGLVHRDIKPHNVILTRTGAKLLDFNIASRVGDGVYTMSGTPPYQPPGVDLTRWDVSTDLFAVGVMLYELLCDGQHPYPNSQPMIGETVIDPRTIRSGLDSDLAEFLIRACAPDRADRFSTAAEMRLALRNVRDHL
jgi:serine/threonine protein kinase